MKEKKTGPSLFDWIQLIVSISIPVAIAVYTVLENNRELSIAIANREHDLDIADNEQKDFILNECQKVLNRLFEKYGTQFEPGSSASLIARFAVLSALDRLDATRRNFLVRLLYETKLITCKTVFCKPSIDLQSVNLMDLSLSRPYKSHDLLYHISLENAVLSRANFSTMNIYGGKFNGAILDDADFTWTRNDFAFEACQGEFCMENVSAPLSFGKANLNGASFRAASYGRADFTDAKMVNANLKMFYCTNCQFIGTNMNSVDFRSGQFENTSIYFSSLDHANIYGSKIGPNVEFYGYSMQNANAQYTNFSQCQIVDVDLQNTLFNHASFHNVNFTNTKMMNVCMESSRVTYTRFTSISLSGSNLRYAYFEQCVFDGVDFTRADLSHAMFIKCDLMNTTIAESQLKQTASLQYSLLPSTIV